MSALRSAAPGILPALERYREDIERCVKCGSCSAVCPSYLVERNESYSARGRVALVKAVLDGRLAVSETFRDRMATCAGCLACEASCPAGVRVIEILQAARELAHDALGTGFIAGSIAMAVKHPALFRSSSVFAPLMLHLRREIRRSSSERTRQTAHGKPSRVLGRVAFFAGCGINYFQPELRSAVRAVLGAYGFEVLEPEGLRCCGRPLLSLGERKAAKEIAEKNAAALAGADAIVTAYASCGLTFKRDYPILLPRGIGRPHVLDIHEFLAAHAPPEMTTGADLRMVTIHEGCHLGRGQGLSRTVRRLVQALPGVRIVEMKDPGACCGFGGVMRRSHRSHSDAIADRRVGDIVGTEAETVVTGCPGCRMQLAGALHRRKADVEVIHTLQLMERLLADRE